MAELWIQSVGEPGLYTSEEDERPHITGKPVVLLTYLALAPDRRAGRDHLAELFWRGSDEHSDALHSLRQALYRLRSAVADSEIVAAEGPHVCLSRNLRLDALEAERALASGDYVRATQLLAAGFLRGWTFPDCSELESWVEAQRVRFADVWAQAARKEVERLLSEGNPERALPLAEAMAKQQPFDDEPQHALMKCLSALGRHAVALARFQMHSDFLAREADDAPGAELAEYADRLEAFVTGNGEAKGHLLPFVGRSEEWALLEGMWNSAREGAGATVLVEGAAGLGKTRLLDELSDRVRPDGAIVLQAKSFEFEATVPYGALAEALAPALRAPSLDSLNRAWLAEASRVLPELRDRFSDLPRVEDRPGSAAAKRRLHGALVALVDAAAAPQGAILVVDDLHWTDPPTLEVLHRLAHRARECRLLLALAYRPAELSTAARRFARSVLADRVARLCVLEPLTPEHVKALLGQIADFDDEATGNLVAGHLEGQSAGSPLFLTELLDALRTSGVLRVEDGTWRLTAGAVGEELPATLGKLISDRIDRLQPWMRTCLEMIAVLGGDASVPTLSRAMRVSEPRAEVAIAALREERLVKRSPGGGYELFHDEMRRLVYQDTPDSRRRILHFAAGRTLEEAGEEQRPGGAARLAYHFDLGGDAERAHRFARAAAEEAEVLGAAATHRRHLELATAHSPMALPPGEEADAGSEIRRLGGRVVAAAVVAGTLLGLGWATRPILFPSDSAAGYRQGAISFSTVDHFSPTHRLNWPSRSRDPGFLVPATRAAGIPHVVGRWVTDGEETHYKLFRATDDGETQITFGSTDEYRVGWTRDGSRLAVLRGRRLGPEDWAVELAILRADGTIESVIDDPERPVQSAAVAGWGTKLVMIVDSAGSRRVWTSDLDGRRATDVSSRFALPGTPEALGLSADGSKLALIFPEGTDWLLRLLALDETTSREIPWPHDARPLGNIVWSPDHEWLAYVVPADSVWNVMALPVDGTAPVVLAQHTEQIYTADWQGQPPTYVEEVVAQPRRVQLRRGEGLSLSATVRDAEGRELPFTPRFVALDSAVVGADANGFIRGRAVGTTGVEVSAGGFASDTVLVEVVFAERDTLLVEDWSEGLRPTIWRSFGRPSARVVREDGVAGPALLDTNGDYNHASGVLSVDSFPIGAHGYTLSVEAHVDFHQRYFLHWSAGFIADTTKLQSGEMVSGAEAGLGLTPGEPDPDELQWTGCAHWSYLATGALEPGESRPINVTVQIRPDGVAECYADGRLLSADPLPRPESIRALRILLAGRTQGSNVYHGRVALVRGLTY